MFSRFTRRHVLGGFLWPHSVYGTMNPSRWEWVRDVSLMTIEDLALAFFNGRM